MNNSNILSNEIIEIIIGIVGTIIGIILTHFLYYSKLKKEQKSKILSKITKDRIDAVNKIKELISQLNQVEKVSYLHPDVESNIDKYIFIFNDWNICNNFIKKYRKLRNKYEELLNIRCLMYMIIGDRYLWDLQKLVFYFGDERLYILGTVLSKEIDIWRRKFIHNLNKFLNNPPLKYQSKIGLKYIIMLKYTLYKYHRTILYKELIKGTSLEREDMKNAYNEIENKIKQIINNK